MNSEVLAMPTNAPPFDVSVAHRWFAVELNNSAWDLVEAPQRTPEEVERMIHAAHAACFHWAQAGTLLNQLRAACLLATAYAKAGIAERAVSYAERCLALSDELGSDQTSFDIASAHGCASAAYRLAGRMDDARKQYGLMCGNIEPFEDEADAAAFDRLYPPP
jgi:hypothetical protein